MKKFFFLFTILFSSLCFTGCFSSDEPAEIIIDSGIKILVADSLKFTADAREQSVSFSTNKPWTVTFTNPHDKRWCTVSPENGEAGKGFFVINVTENEEYDDRCAVLILKAEKRTKIITIKQKQKFIDCSSRGTANCYIVKPDTYGKIDATVKGNNPSFKIRLTSLATAKIVWQKGYDDNNNPIDKVIDNVIYKNDHIYFKTLSNKGNAVIAIVDNGEILWSWHIWIAADADSINNFTSTTRLGFMDRNIGASSKIDIGLYYQWGRKDPFTLGCYTTSLRADNLEDAIKNPNVFYCSSSPRKSEWFRGMKIDLWGASKTIYDPSPYGYKVPPCGSWTPSEENYKGEIWSEYSILDFFYYDQPDAIYPWPLVIESNQGTLVHSGRFVLTGYWTSTGVSFDFNNDLIPCAEFMVPCCLKTDAVMWCTQGLCIRSIRDYSEN